MIDAGKLAQGFVENIKSAAVGLIYDEPSVEPAPLTPEQQSQGIQGVMGAASGVLKKAGALAAQLGPQYEKDRNTAALAVAEYADFSGWSKYTQASISFAVARQIVQADRQAPEVGIMRMVEDDFQRALALTDPEILNLVASGKGIHNPDVAALIDAFTDASLAQVSTGLYHQTLKAEEDNRRGVVENLLQRDNSMFRDQLTDAEVKGGTIITDLTEQGADWVFDTETSVLSVEAPGKGNIVIKVDDGSDIKTNLDAVEAIYRAVTGKANIVIKQDEVPGAGNVIGDILRTVGGIGQWVEGNAVGRVAEEAVVSSLRAAWAGLTLPVGAAAGALGFEDFPFIVTPTELQRTPLVLHEKRINAELEKGIQQEAVLAEAAKAVDDGVGVVWAARRIAATMREAGIDVPKTGTLLAMGEEYYALEKEAIDDDILQMTTKDVEAQFAAQPDQPALASWMGDGIGGVLTLFSVWDTVTQHIGIGVVDALGDVGMGLRALLAGDEQEGLNRLADVLTEYPTDVDTVGDWFNLEGDWREYVNLGSSIVFDPLNLAFFGPSAARGVVSLMTTDARFMHLFAHQPQWRSFAKGLVGGGPEKVINVLALSGLRPAARAELRAIALADKLTKGAPEYDAALEAVRRIITGELPAAGTGGWFLGDGVGRATRRQTALGLGKMFAQDNPLDNPTLVKALANGSTERYIALGEHGYVDLAQDMIVQMWANDPKAVAAWAEKLDNALEVAHANRNFRTGVASTRAQQLADEEIALRAQAKIVRADGTTLGVDKLTDLEDEYKIIDAILAEWATTGKEPRVITQGVNVSKAEVKQYAIDTGLSESDAADILRNAIVGQQQQELIDRSVELSNDIATLQPVAAKLNDDLADLARRSGRLRVELNVLDEPDSRLPLIDFIYSMYEEKAKTIRWVEEIKDAKGNVTSRVDRVGLNPRLDKEGKVLLHKGSNVPSYDWTPVTGRQRQFHIVTTDDNGVATSSVGFIGGADTAQEQQQAAALAQLFNIDQNYMGLPVSTAELLAYEAMNDGTKWAGVINALDAIAGSAAARAARTAFGVNLLFNFTTPIKAHLDEVIRFYASTGSIPDTLLALREAPWLRNMLNAVDNQLAKVGLHVPTGGESAAAKAFARTSTGGIGKSSVGQYDWVSQPAKRAAGDWAHYSDQVNRFLGVVTTDDAFRAYAKAIIGGEKIPRMGTVTGAPASFVEWWETYGKFKRANIIMGKSGAKQMTATDAWRIMDDSWGMFMDRLVVATQPLEGRVRKAILEAAVEGRPIQFSDDIIRAFPRVPGVAQWNGTDDGIRGLLDSGFQHLYGTPSERRGAVFFEYKYDQVLGELVRAAEGNGTLLNESRLVAELAKAGQVVSPDEARVMLLDAVRSQQVQQVMRNNSTLVLLPTLESRARVEASRFADDLMYRMVSSSALGKAVDSPLLFPFARAQNDFMSWWTKYLFRPMQMRTGLTAEGSVARRASWLDENASAFQKALEGAVSTIESMPINMRVWSRFAHLAVQHSNDHESGLDKAINAFTFLPLKFTNNILMNLYPQLGPLSDFTFDLASGIPGLKPLSEVVNSIFPGTGFTDEIDWSDPGAVSLEFFNRMIPDSPRSVRNLVGSVGALTRSVIPGMAPFDPRTASLGDQILANMFLYENMPVGYLDTVSANIGDLFRDRYFQDGLVPGSDKFASEIGRISLTAMTDKARDEEWNDIARQVPFVSKITSDRAALRNYQALVDNVPLLFDLGVIGLQDVDELPTAFKHFMEGTATDRELTYIGDVASTILFDKLPDKTYPNGVSVRDSLIALHPELAVMMVGKFTINPAAPKEWQDLYWDDVRKRFKFPPGEEGRDIRDEALAKGYMANKPDYGEDGWATDAGRLVNAAVSRVLSQFWQAKTTREWSNGMLKAMETKVYTISPSEAQLFNTFHLPIQAGQYTGTQMREEFDAIKDSLATNYDENDLFKSGTMTTLSSGGAGSLGREVFNTMDAVAKSQAKNGVDSYYDWPEPVKQGVRDLFKSLVESGVVSPVDYAKDIQPIFGEVDFAPPEVPALSDLTDKRGFSVPSSWVAVGSGASEAAQILDGDSVRLFTKDGDIEVRLMGIAAPERTEPGYGEATEKLRDFMLSHDVEFRVWKPEVYGLQQTLGSEGSTRLRLWMFADGVPVYDPSLFTTENVLGREASVGAVPDYEGMLRVQKERLGVPVEAVS